jgi:hypothetical protein
VELLSEALELRLQGVGGQLPHRGGLCEGED